MVLREVHVNAITLEPFGMSEGDKQVDNEGYATYKPDPVLGAHQVLRVRGSGQILRADQASRPTCKKGYSSAAEGGRERRMRFVYAPRQQNRQDYPAVARQLRTRGASSVPGRVPRW